MRPQHFAAEYFRYRRMAGENGFASMRPQHFAAEYVRAGDNRVNHKQIASMRPQHFAAEYCSLSAVMSSFSACFNEAAAFRCGIPESAVMKTASEIDKLQ